MRSGTCFIHPLAPGSPWGAPKASGKRPHTHQKRSCACQKRPTQRPTICQKRPHTHQKRSCAWQKRPIQQRIDGKGGVHTRTQSSCHTQSHHCSTHPTLDYHFSSRSHTKYYSIKTSLQQQKRMRDAKIQHGHALPKIDETATNHTKTHIWHQTGPPNDSRSITNLAP